MLAGVDETDGVDGGVIPPIPRDPFGEPLFSADTGEGILYLKCVYFFRLVSLQIVMAKVFGFTFDVLTALDQHPLTPIVWPND